MKKKTLRVASCELREGRSAKPQAVKHSYWQPATGNSELLPAFTLIELMVTIGIIAVLVGILVPLVTKSIGKAHRVRLQQDLQTISTALEAYKSDFGDYPRPEYGGAAFSSTDPTHPNPPTGAEILCRALIGPAPANDASDNTPATVIPAQDGADGPGFTLRLAVKDANGNWVSQGRKYGPYLAADKFKVYSLNAVSAGAVPTEASSNQPTVAAGGTFNPLTAVIADIDGNPILYFPGRALKPDITVKQYYVGLSSSPPDPSIQTHTKFSDFDADDNWVYMHYLFHDGQVAWRSSADSSEAASTSSTTTVGFQRICIMFGDYDPGNPAMTTNCDGAIDSPAEHPINEPFVLWCAGPDGKFGTDGTPKGNNPPTENNITKLDDATNIP